MTSSAIGADQDGELALDQAKRPKPETSLASVIPTRLAAIPKVSYALSGVFTAFLVAKCSTFLDGVPHVGGDNAVWSSCGTKRFFSAQFWMCHRPPVVPALHALFGFDELFLVWFQVGVGALSFGAVAYAISRLFPLQFARILAFAAVLCVGLAQPFLLWDLAIRSESISNSLTLLTVAAALVATASLSGGVSRRFYWPCAVSLTLFGLLAAFARDLNAVLLLLLGPCAAAIALLGPRWRARRVKAAILAAALLVAGSASVASASLAKRHLPPFINVVLLRVLPNGERLALFETELGMPVSNELLELKGKTKSWDGNRALNSKDLERFRSWAEGDGFRAYQLYLFTHLPETFAEVWAALPSIARFRHAPNHRPFPEQSLAAWIARGWYAAPWVRAPGLALALSMLLGLGLLIGASFKQRRASLLGLGLLSIGCTLTFLAFHGDGIEVPRHAVGGWLLVVLGGVVVWAAGLERAWQFGRRLRTRAHGGRATSSRAVPTVSALRRQREARSLRRVLLAALGWCAVVALVSSLGIASADYPNRARTARVVRADGTGDPTGPLRGSGSFCFAAKAGAELLFELSEARPANRLFVFGRGGPIQVLVSNDGDSFEEVAKPRKGQVPVGFSGEKPRFVKLVATSDQGPCVEDLHYFTAEPRAKRSGKEED